MARIHTLVIIPMCIILGVTFGRTIVGRNETRSVNRDFRYFEQDFNATIECIRRVLIKGDPASGLPPLDPWRIPEMVRLNIDNKWFWTDLRLHELVIEGLTSFKTTSLSLTQLMKLDVNYHYKKIHLSTPYDGMINVLSMINYAGDGILDVELTDIHIRTSTQYNASPPLIDDYSFIVSVGNVKIEITGIYMGEDWSRYFSILMSYISTKLVDIYQSEISAWASPLIKEYYNSLIGHLPFLDFLEMITNLKCPA